MSNISGKSIMIVDDELDVALTLQLQLQNAGYKVKTYTNPIKALSEFKPHQYDLILLDVRMPHMNGFQLYEKLKMIDKSCRVCFVTAFETYYQSLREFFPNLDIKCFIRKPITEQRLLERVALEMEL